MHGTYQPQRRACLYSFALAAFLVQYVNAAEEATRIRTWTWTAWYNTDKPTSGEQDDERVNSIRRRGWQICGGYSPINAECRDVDNHTLTFDALSSDLVADILDEPCTTAGILCRDSDQRKPRKCANYAIRFECLSVPDSSPPTNIGVIGIAAGLSIVIPVICIAIMHIARVVKRRRRSASRALVSGTSSNESFSRADLPPTYSFLFGDTVRSISEIEFQSENADTGHSNASFSASVTQLSAGTGSQTYSSSRRGSTTLGIPESQSVVSLSPDGLPAGPEVPEPGPRRPSGAWRSRFPNMHVSIFEIFSRSETREPRDVTRPPTPDLSYERTPPPEYKDAVIFLGSREINPEFVPEAKEKEAKEKIELP
ncbi:uncharacterized protein LOC127833302 [Dreissena polymorpha]|uniref:uncharacterized protein LOC127833302 n=1 Tax=Dreissena polymorpha TaxID=45954 RepID=UPI002263C1F2|nr:uncharacterized protein LOC127833302 [Dreissena polymorpha]